MPHDPETARSTCGPRVKALCSSLGIPGLSDKIMAADEYIASFLNRNMLGDPNLHTQDLLGDALFELESKNSATGTWQAQVKHIRSFPDRKTAEWTGHSYVTHYYERDSDGEWKLSGVRPHKSIFEIEKPSDVFGDFE